MGAPAPVALDPGDLFLALPRVPEPAPGSIRPCSTSPPEGVFHVDILTRLGEAFRFKDLESERIDFDGLEVSVVTPATLYRMKKGTVRPRDRGDAERLRQRFGFEDE